MSGAVAFGGQPPNPRGFSGKMKERADGMG